MQTDPQTTKSSNPKDVLSRSESRVLLHLIPSPALIHMAKGFMDGARKYTPYNWRTEGVSATTYISAAQRHIAAWLDGEEDAEDSGVHHLGHALSCLAIILDSQEVGNLVDDRPLPAPTAALLEAEKGKAVEEPEEIHFVDTAYELKLRAALRAAPTNQLFLDLVRRLDEEPAGEVPLD